MSTAAKVGRWAEDALALPNQRGPILEPPRRAPEPPASPAGAKRWLKEQPRPWAIDLFCGAGGLSLGLARAGFTVIAAADADSAALKTHAANLGPLTFHGNLSDPSAFLRFLAERGIRKIDLVAGGPPCQPFSRAGTSKIRSLVASGTRPS